MKFSIVYADCPWEYKAGRCLTPESLLSGEDQTPYPYMSIQDICDLPVESIACDDALLFLWITSPKLNEVFRVGTAWGFEYSTVAFAWEKELVNPGYYTLSSVELCLVFRRRKIPKPRGARNIRQFLQERKTGHSRKPDEIRKRIELMFPSQSKIELFAREAVEGWVAIGNSITGNDIRQDLEFIAAL